jgi:hypothetical protein
MSLPVFMGVYVVLGVFWGGFFNLCVHTFCIRSMSFLESSDFYTLWSALSFILRKYSRALYKNISFFARSSLCIKYFIIPGFNF